MPMICPSCHGSGNMFGLFPTLKADIPKKNIKPYLGIKCDRCNGLGKVSVECKNWIADGLILKEKRILKKITMRSAAKLLKMYPITLSKMERGIIKPNLRIHYDTMKVIRR